MINLFNRNEFIDLEFFLLENEQYKETVASLLQIIGYIKPNKLYFGYYYNDNQEEFNKKKLDKIVESNWDDYEDYLLSIHGSGKQFLNLRISPYLKEVSMCKIRINKSVFEKNKQAIISICEDISSFSSIMYGFADASVSNPYFEKGYGQMKFGAHWLSWYGQWMLQYIDEKRMQTIKENAYSFLKRDVYATAQLYESPWKYRSKQFHQTYRNFMRKVKFEELVLEYNKKHEFQEVEKEDLLFGNNNNEN
ncbi:MAG: hypothetical protein PUE01_12885 [Clostridiaceae bacterium]|nr:hypothetical protein [Clostridiaceae bacterium]